MAESGSLGVSIDSVPVVMVDIIHSRRSASKSSEFLPQFVTYRVLLHFPPPASKRYMDAAGDFKSNQRSIGFAA
jgi:hypothetical protein